MNRLVAILLIALSVSTARAHLMPAEHGIARIDRDGIFMVVAVPVAALTGYDHDSDGLMSLEELTSSRDHVLSQLRQRITTTTGYDEARITFEDLVLPHADNGESKPVAHVILMRRTRTTIDDTGFEIAVDPSLGPIEFVATSSDLHQESHRLERQAAVARFFDLSQRSLLQRAIALFERARRSF